MHQPGEPSVEEILDSIKKVIARDNREGMIAERRRRTQDVQAHDPADVAGEGERAGILELGAEAMVGLELDTANEPHVEAGDAALTRSDTMESMRQNFAALAMLSMPGKQPQIVRSGETSLEGLVREMLRPMLAQWIDANLPSMVEELVKAEIARIAGKRG